jgi:hypothetical protein
MSPVQSAGARKEHLYVIRDVDALLTGSSARDKHDWDGRRDLFGSKGRRCAHSHDDIDLMLHVPGRELAMPV